MDKRHFYECGSETLSWEQDWYTQPWFTINRQSYDRAASDGPVNPPGEVYQTVSECSRLLSGAGFPITTTKRTYGTSLGTLTIFGQATGGVTSGISSRTSLVPPTITKSPSLSTDPTLISTSILPSPTDPRAISVLQPSAVSTARAGGIVGIAENSCAGQWDFQAAEVVVSLGIGLLFGLIIWLTWGVLRSRIPGLYSTRRWFLPPSSQSSSWSFLVFFLPFLHLPSTSFPAPLSEGQLSLHSMFAVLKLAALTSLLSLAAGLPLFLINTPCLRYTSPPNSIGHLGSFTDLSILRLLNSLDPSPDSSTTSSFLHLPAYIRALPSTIAPAIGSARVRLIVLLVIIAVLGCGGSLFILARTYTTLARYSLRFRKISAGGMEMVIIPAKSAPAWQGLSEEGIKRRLTDRTGKIVQGDEHDKDRIEVIGVTAVPDTEDLRRKVKEREIILHKLEEAETKYINSFRLVRTNSSSQQLEPVTVQGGTEQGTISEKGPTDFLAPKGYYKLSSGRSKAGPSQSLDVPDVPAPQVARPNQDTRFHEINRDSMLLGRLALGQRVRINSLGQITPDPSPDSEGSNPLGTPGADRAAVRQTPEASGPNLSPRQIPLPPSPDQPEDHLPHMREGPERRPVLHTPPHAAIVASERPSPHASPLGLHYMEIREQRSRFKLINEEIELAQRKAFEQAAKGINVVGWTMVGKGVKWIPGAALVEGYSLDDIIWENVEKSAKIWIFWVQVALIGLIVAGIMIPFLGLSEATAPGFANYLDFLRPVVRLNAVGEGVVEGLVPATALTMTVGLALWAIKYFSKRIRVVSRTRQRFLAYKATFYFLLVIVLVLGITIAALEYGVQALETGVQPARFVGDGVIYSTWLIFVVMLNMAIIVPGLYLLRPIRLFKYLRQGGKARTPRQRFRQRLPSSFNPSYALLPFLIAVFYAFSLVFLFPLVAIPILLLIYLGMVANRYMIDHVQVEGIGYGGATIGLWTIRRFGWVLAVQPGLYGLILLSRREWGLGGPALGVAVIVVILSELLTVRRYPRTRIGELSSTSQEAIRAIERDIRQAPNTSSGTAFPSLRTRVSESSMLQRLTALLPGYSRLPPDCPVPIPTEKIHDLFQTEKASFIRPSLINGSRAEDGDGDGRRFFHYPTEKLRGLVYPPEMLCPVPVIWLPRDEAGVAEGEASDLERYHDLVGIVDPTDEDVKRRESAIRDVHGARSRRSEET